MIDLTWLWNSYIDALNAHIFAPAIAYAGLAKVIPDPRDAAEFFGINIVAIAIIAFVFRPLESVVPVEHWESRRPTRIDMIYTLMKAFGLVPIFTFFLILPLGRYVDSLMGSGDGPSGIPALIPWFQQHEVAMFLLAFVLLDLTQYLIHRLQHVVPWWWALHSLHHSQRHISVWSDDRNHLIDDVLEGLIQGVVGILIGVDPDKYVALILFGRLIENFSHANVRVRFGPVLDKLFVDPQFHRAHHRMATPEEPHIHDCNYALVLPVWDILFRTAIYDGRVLPCGVNSPEVDADNQRNWLGQQIAGARRFAHALRPRRKPKRRRKSDAPIPAE
jgi:sterol desaturase/sphingolipid hydroxylase (fatty acid hydroxylase superfamily)